MLAFISVLSTIKLFVYQHTGCLKNMQKYQSNLPNIEMSDTSLFMFFEAGPHYSVVALNASATLKCCKDVFWVF